MSETIPPEYAELLSDTELQSLIARHLPAWQQACDADDSDSIVLHEASFSTSTYELFLFACAIKYAAAKSKHVHVVSGTGRTNREPETVLPSAALGSVYREKTADTRHTPTSSSPKKTKTKD